VGDVTSQRGWRGRPWLSRTIRLTAHAIPFVVVTLVIWQVNRALGEPSGRAEAILRWIALSAVSTLALIGLDRLARRLLPLATLFQLSLIFPDEAPSRFSIALRQNTTRGLQRDLEDGTLAPGTPQEAAEILLTLVAELSRHDRLTRGHAERVRAYAEMVGRELKLGEEERSKLQWAALLHDIGKLKVPASILAKKGKPTPREWTTLKTHPDEGWKLIAPLRPWLGEWARAVRDHHERWDGDGYPRGLAGARISRAGRIVAVVDAFDVMTSTRSYKAPTSVPEARAELARCAGSQFDQEIVRAFLAVGIGRLRLVMGPLSWLAQLPALTRLPVGQLPAAAVSTAAAATVAVSSIVTPFEEEAPDPAAARIVAEEEVAFDEPVALSSAPDSAELPPLPTPTRPTPTNAPTTAPDSTTTTEPTTPTTSTTTTVVTTTSTTTTVVTTTSTAPTTTAAPTTVPPTTTTTSPPDLLALVHLGSTGEGPAVWILPLVGPPTQTVLPNYDTDQDNDPGRTIKRSNENLPDLDPRDIQVWAVTLGGDFLAVGTPRLDIWAAARDFDLGSQSSLTASLVVCPPSGQGCTLLSTAVSTFRQADFGSSFGLLTITMPEVNVFLPAGSRVGVAVTVPKSSDDDVWIAFDTVDYPSRGSLG
jgi:HD-GYP domain-containing protein (c-di-GMP phosphodiesterase class II)